MKRTTTTTRRLAVETLERRDLLTISVVGNTLSIPGTSGNDTVRVTETNVDWLGRFITVNVNGASRQFDAGGITTIAFDGGAGDDSFELTGYSLKASAKGGAGNDTLIGSTGNDTLFGGIGNDQIRGGAGNDKLNGETGNDIVRGDAGNDTLYLGQGNDRGFGDAGSDIIFGGTGNDQIWGGADADKLNGDDGDDTLVSLDNALSDVLTGGRGRDSFWCDQSAVQSLRTADKIKDLSARFEAANVHKITSFANGADRTLDGDDIADPADGANYRNFSGNPLFPTAGPGVTDVFQAGGVPTTAPRQDCWLLSGLGAIAKASKNAARQLVADLGDGTYAVKIAGKYYRVDADLPTDGAATPKPTNAGLGRQNALWVPIVEKAYALHRTTAKTYASLDFGTTGEGLQNLNTSGLTVKNFTAYQATTSAEAAGLAMMEEMAVRMAEGKAVILGTFAQVGMAPLQPLHVYMVVSFTWDKDTGNMVSVTLRNPRGMDSENGRWDDVNDGYVTVTAAQLGGATGEVAWAKAAGGVA